jgi:hypothetical protein
VTGPTEADLAHAHDATLRGPTEVSGWQVKRWREAGQLHTTRRFRGRGAGSDPVAYPPESAAYTAAFAEALSRSETITEACLVCFLEGHRPPEKALRKAYVDGYRRVRAWLERQAGCGDAWTIAEGVSLFLSRRAAGIPRLREAKERLRKAGKQPNTLRGVVANTLATFLGAASLHPDSLTAFGMSGLLQPIGSLGALASTDDLKLASLNFDDLSNTAAEASLAELEHARDAYTSLLDVATTFASVASRTNGLRLDALTEFEGNDATAALVAIPAVILMRGQIGATTFDTTLADFRALLPQMHATTRLLDAIPPELHPHVSPDVATLAGLPDPTREQLFTAIRGYLDSHPDDSAIFNAAQSDQPDQTT